MWAHVRAFYGGSVAWVVRQYWNPKLGATYYNVSSSLVFSDRPLRVLTVALGYKTGFWDEGAGRVAEAQRDAIRRRALRARAHVWAWVGNLRKSSRKDAVDRLTEANLGASAVHHADGFVAATNPLEASDVRRFLSDAAFQPCPEGNWNVDTFRLSETLDVGALPIVRATGRNQLGVRYWDALFGPLHPLLVTTGFDASGAPAMLRELLAPAREHRLEAYHQAVADWWLNYKWSVRSQLARWMSEA